jgi:DNA-binding NarL/FixJ family response regulator
VELAARLARAYTADGTSVRLLVTDSRLSRYAVWNRQEPTGAQWRRPVRSAHGAAARRLDSTINVAEALLATLPDSPPASPLSDRQAEVMRLVAVGESTAQIARATRCFTRTIYSVVHDVYRATGTDDRGLALAACLRNRWIALHPHELGRPLPTRLEFPRRRGTVFLLLCQGKPYRAIAETLQMSASTVRNHGIAGLDQWGARSRYEAITMAHLLARHDSQEGRRRQR